MVEKIISGAQSGCDRAALDVALELGIPHGGYCPRGRLAEDGPIPDRYQLTELASPDYPARTRANVEAADYTLVLTVGRLTGGTLLTVKLCGTRPHAVIDLDRADAATVAMVREALAACRVRVLNVAGPRESRCPGIHDKAAEFLRKVLAKEYA